MSSLRQRVTRIEQALPAPEPHCDLIAEASIESLALALARENTDPDREGFTWEEWLELARRLKQQRSSEQEGGQGQSGRLSAASGGIGGAIPG